MASEEEARGLSKEQEPLPKAPQQDPGASTPCPPAAHMCSWGQPRTKHGAGSFLPTPCAAPAPKCRVLQDGPRASHLKPFRVPGAPHTLRAVPRLMTEQPLVTCAWWCWQHRHLCFSLTASWKNRVRFAWLCKQPSVLTAEKTNK